jgi:hypothetical protein
MELLGQLSDEFRPRKRKKQSEQQKKLAMWLKK